MEIAELERASLAPYTFLELFNPKSTQPDPRHLREHAALGFVSMASQHEDEPVVGDVGHSNILKPRRTQDWELPEGVGGYFAVGRPITLLPGGRFLFTTTTTEFVYLWDLGCPRFTSDKSSQISTNGGSEVVEEPRLVAKLDLSKLWLANMRISPGEGDQVLVVGDHVSESEVSSYVCSIP